MPMRWPYTRFIEHKKPIFQREQKGEAHTISLFIKLNEQFTRSFFSLIFFT